MDRAEIISDLSRRAAALPPEELEAFLDQHCAGDAALRAQIWARVANTQLPDRHRQSSATTLAFIPDSAVRMPEVPRHRLQRRLGGGGQADGYLAIAETGRPGAVKVLRD